jgi:hypothetical protein
MVARFIGYKVEEPEKPARRLSVEESTEQIMSALFGGKSMGPPTRRGSPGKPDPRLPEL